MRDFFRQRFSRNLNVTICIRCGVAYFGYVFFRLFGLCDQLVIRFGAGVIHDSHFTELRRESHISGLHIVNRNLLQALTAAECQQ